MSDRTGKSLTEASGLSAAPFGNESLQDEYMLKAQGGGTPASPAEMATWFKSKGYETTLEQVRDEWVEETNNTLDFYAGTYNTYLNGKVGPTLSIDGGVVKINDKEIIEPLFTMSKLSWTSAKNPSNGYIDLIIFNSQLKQADGTEAPEDANIFIGAQFKGTYWTAGPKPTASNFYGRQGLSPVDFIQKLAASTTVGTTETTAPTPPPKASSLSQWADKYSIFASNAAGEWPATNDTVVIAKDGATVKYDDTTIVKVQFDGQMLSWDAADGNPCNFVVVMRRVDHSTARNPWTGNQFYGKRWAAGEPRPATGNILGVIGASPSANVSQAAATQARSSEAAAGGHSFGMDLLQMALAMTLAHYMIQGSGLLLQGMQWGGAKLWDKVKEKRARSLEIAEAKKIEDAFEAGKEGTRLAGEKAAERAAKAADAEVEAAARKAREEAAAQKAQEEEAAAKKAKEEAQLRNEADLGRVQSDVLEGQLRNEAVGRGEIELGGPRIGELEAEGRLPRPEPEVRIELPRVRLPLP